MLISVPDLSSTDTTTLMGRKRFNIVYAHTKSLLWGIGDLLLGPEKDNSEVAPRFC